MSAPLYWQTMYGSICERQAGPDAEGWMTFRRLRDNAIREWRACDMRPLSDAEVIEMAKGAIDAIS